MAEIPSQEVTVQVGTATMFRVLFLLLLVVFLYLIRDVLIIILFSVVIASALNPAVGWLGRRGLPRALATFIVFIVLFLLLALILYLVIRPLSNELVGLSETLPAYFDRLLITFEEQAGTEQYEQVLANVQNYLSQIGNSLRGAASNIFVALARLFGGIATAVMVIVISFYLTAQERGIALFLRAVTPAQHQNYILDLWSRSQNKMGRWLRGQVVLSLIVGILVFIGLTIFGIRYSVLLALLAAAFEIIPFIGPLLAAIPAVILAFLKSPIVALWTALVYVIVQQLENTVLAPKIMERAVGLNPVVVIIAVLIGGHLFGIIGIILAVPLAAVAVEIIKDFGKRRNHEPIQAS